ncbi:MAG: aspartate aminotransferase family protein, partial [Acidimicrobiales bacterium]
LLLAVELDGVDAPAVAADCLTAGLVVNGVTPTAIRMAPPLIIEDAHIAEAAAVLGSVLVQHTGGSS